MNIGTLTIALGVDFSGLVAANAAMSKFAHNTTTSLNTISQRFRTTGYLMSMALTAPIVMAGKSAINMAKDFEFSMQKIVGLAGVAQDAVNGWSDALLKMGPEVAKKPQELAEALYYISSSGIKGAEALDVLKLSAKAASAGLGETKDVANFLTSALNAYADTGLTAAYAVDVLVAGVREGKAEATGFATAIGQLIPIASGLGVSLDQVVGAMAATTLTGSSAANSAVYLKGVFNALMTANDQGRVVLKKVNSSYADLRKILRTGPEGLINLMEKLREVQTKLGDEGIKDVLPNIRALTEYMSVAGKNFQYNTEIMKKVTNATGSLGVAWAAVADTIKIRFDQAISKANVSLITLGKSVAEAIIPILEKLVGGLDRLTKWFDSLTEAQKRHKLITVAIIAALGPVSLLFSVLGYTITWLIAIIKGLVWVFNVLKIVMTTNPIYAVIGVISLLAGGFLLLKNRTKDAADEQDRINKLWEEGTRINEQKKTIEERMSVLFSLDKRQTENLRNELGTQLFLYEDQATKIIAAKKNWAFEDPGLQKKQKDLAFAESESKKWNEIISSESENQRKLWADDVIAKRASVKSMMDSMDQYYNGQLDTNKKSIDQTKQYIEQVDAALKKFPKTAAELLEDQAAAAAKLRSQLEADTRLLEEWLHINQDIYKKKYGQTPALFPKDVAKTAGMRVQTLGEFGLPKGPPTFMPDSVTFLEEQNKAMEESLAKARVFAATLTNIFSDMFMNMGEGFKGMIDSVVEGLKRLAAEVMARIAVWLILMLISGGTEGALGLVKGARKMIEGGFGDFIFKGLGRGMANGGTIPSGYPHDTYPALLSSGERVLPTGINRADNMRIEVDEIKIRGSDLVILLRRAGAYN